VLNTLVRSTMIGIMGPKETDPAGVLKPTVPIAGDDVAFPKGSANETELLLQFLDYQRHAVQRKACGLSEDEARWTPDGKLIPLIGIVNHLTQMEWRWMDGGFSGAEVSHDDAEFHPGPAFTLDAVLEAYRERATKTNAMARSMPLTTVGSGWARDHDLRFVLLHLIDETARHAGHADATREMLDGKIGL
jgi:hypothetical protein